jgi:hypothetical protein
MKARRSIPPTYDREAAGPQYHTTTKVNGRPITWCEAAEDPFVRVTVNLGWRDLLAGLLRRNMSVEVLVGGSEEVMEDVLELNADYIGRPGSTRRADWCAGLQASIAKIGRDT